MSTKRRSKKSSQVKIRTLLPITTKHIAGFSTILLSEIIAAILTYFFASDFSLTLNKTHIIIIVSFLLLIDYLLFIMFSNYIKGIQEINELKQQLTEKIQIDNKDIKSKGDILFQIALGLDSYEPMKTDILHEAAIVYHHYISGIYLGNLYFNGLKKDNIVIINKDHQKSFYYYSSVIDCDPTGVAAWRIGWLYECGYIEKHLDETEQMKLAFEYYKRSADYGYPKAHNSLGKFYQFKKEVTETDIVKASHHYHLGAEGGDIYATLNGAYIHALNPNEFDLAKRCFEKAISMKSSLAWRKYGLFLEYNFNTPEHPEITIDEILNCYLNATQYGSGVDYARSYILIGKLIQKYPDDINKTTKTNILKDGFGKCEDRCFAHAYQSLKSIVNSGVNLKGREIEDYEFLKNMFEE